MSKYHHEIRDPIHAFIRLDSDERKVLDSRPLQRLRHIHQLAMTFLVYPGATHRRFEHSLGAMELASRVYDVITDPENIDPSVSGLLPRKDQVEHGTWRRTLRMAALCHDVGHLPFSHAAEKELLPEGWTHERLTETIIESDELRKLWKRLHVNADEVAKLAVGPKHYRKKPFSELEAILAEIITGDAFGVDRIDYLLRDSHHAGVAYGRFDHYRLLDTLRVLPFQRAQKKSGTSKKGNASGCSEETSTEPTLGMHEDGIHTAEALMLARYFMYTQLYFHPVRRIYDRHLQDFLKAWLDGGQFSTQIEKHLELTDNEVTAALHRNAKERSSAGYDPARRIVYRQHYKQIYQRNEEDIQKNPEAAHRVFEAACSMFGPDNVKYDSYIQRSAGTDFPVLTDDDRVSSSMTISTALAKMPVVATEYVYVEPAIRERAERWLKSNRARIIASQDREE